MLSHISVIDGGRILLAGCGDNTGSVIDVRTKKKKRSHWGMSVASSDARRAEQNTAGRIGTGNCEVEN
jgi:hypothetical protein